MVYQYAIGIFFTCLDGNVIIYDSNNGYFKNFKTYGQKALIVQYLPDGNFDWLTESDYHDMDRDGVDVAIVERCGDQK